MSEISKVTIEDAQIIFRNFEGKAGPFNDEGKRRFSIVLPEDEANHLASQGWNVKRRDPKEEDDDVLIHLPVEVNYKNRPPHIVMLTSTGRTTLTEDMVSILDFADIQKVDLVLNPYEWQMPSGTSGVKAYLKTMFVHVDEDDLERKYAETANYDDQNEE